MSIFGRYWTEKVSSMSILGAAGLRNAFQCQFWKLLDWEGNFDVYIYIYVFYFICFIWGEVLD